MTTYGTWIGIPARSPGELARLAERCDAARAAYLAALHRAASEANSAYAASVAHLAPCPAEPLRTGRARALVDQDAVVLETDHPRLVFSLRDAWALVDALADACHAATRSPTAPRDQT